MEVLQESELTKVWCRVAMQDALLDRGYAAGLICIANECPLQEGMPLDQRKLVVVRGKNVVKCEDAD